MYTQPDSYRHMHTESTLDDLKQLERLSTQIDKKEAMLKVLENGMILHCNEAAADLLGSAPNKLVWQPIARFIPQLAEQSLMLEEKINPYLRFLSVAGHRYEVIRLNGTHFASELFFSFVKEFGNCCLKITFQPIRDGQAASLRHLRTY